MIFQKQPAEPDEQSFEEQDMQAPENELEEWRKTLRQARQIAREALDRARHIQELCTQDALAWLNDKALFAEDNSNSIQTRVEAYHQIDCAVWMAENREEKKAKLAREENQRLVKKRGKLGQWGSEQVRGHQTMEGDQMRRTPNMPHELDNEKYTACIHDTAQAGASHPPPLPQVSRLSHALRHLNLHRTSESGVENFRM